MKKIHICLLIGVVLPALSFLSSCTQKINYREIHTYKPEEVKKLFDNALKIEMVGEPIIETTEHRIDSSETLTQTVTTQTYLLYVGRTKDDHLIPISEIKESEVEAMINDGRGPIVGSSSCTMHCKFGVVRCPDATGCAPDHRGGCSSFNCGSGCVTVSCSPGFAGFGFGRAIIF